MEIVKWLVAVRMTRARQIMPVWKRKKGTEKTSLTEVRIDFYSPHMSKETKKRFYSRPNLKIRNRALRDDRRERFFTFIKHVANIFTASEKSEALRNERCAQPLHFSILSKDYRAAKMKSFFSE